MRKTTGFYPCVREDSAPVAAVGSAGRVLQTTSEVKGLSAELRHGLSRWRNPTVVHDPGKVVTDLALTLALGGDCLSAAPNFKREYGAEGDGPG